MTIAKKTSKSDAMFFGHCKAKNEDFAFRKKNKILMLLAIHYIPPKF